MVLGSVQLAFGVFVVPVKPDRDGGAADPQVLPSRLERGRSPVYHRYMASTTVKLSVETRDRIRALGGDTYEDTIIEALDMLEAERFWAQADAAASWRGSLTDDERAALVAREAEIDAAFDGIE